jgi:hypothetical protein
MSNGLCHAPRIVDGRAPRHCRLRRLGRYRRCHNGVYISWHDELCESVCNHIPLRLQSRLWRHISHTAESSTARRRGGGPPTAVHQHGDTGDKHGHIIYILCCMYVCMYVLSTTLTCEHGVRVMRWSRATSLILERCLQPCVHKHGSDNPTCLRDCVLFLSCFRRGYGTGSTAQ